jgi:chromosomal replication initiation ATPase DnaA
MSRQEPLPLALERRVAKGRGDFLAAPCNAGALAALEGWRGWPGGRLVLVGPEGSGKSHLVAIWREETGARSVAAADLGGTDPAALAGGPLAVEDIDAPAARLPEAERGLLHLANLMAERGSPLLLTAREAPARRPPGLADLASRLAAAPVARIGPPDDALLSSLLVKLAADRQLRLAPRVVQHLARRMERSYATIGRVVDALDRASLAENRTISRELASEILEGLDRD